MDTDALEQSVLDFLLEDGYREDVHGEYHPSTISGCPARAVLDRMVESDPVANSWLFQGTAVHEYLESEGRIDSILENGGYEDSDVRKEVTTAFEITDDVTIVGTCDLLVEDGEETAIFDLKYSSLKPEYGHGRVMKYLSQANTYSYMFGADEYALIMIHSSSQDLRDGVNVLAGQKSDENWEIVKEKAQQIHEALEMASQPAGNRWTHEQLEEAGEGFWEQLFSVVEFDYSPSYEEECNHCPFEESCPASNDEYGWDDHGAMGNKLK